MSDWHPRTNGERTKWISICYSTNWVFHKLTKTESEQRRMKEVKKWTSNFKQSDTYIVIRTNGRRRSFSVFIPFVPLYLKKKNRISYRNRFFRSEANKWKWTHTENIKIENKTKKRTNNKIWKRQNEPNELGRPKQKRERLSFFFFCSTVWKKIRNNNDSGPKAYNTLNGVWTLCGVSVLCSHCSHMCVEYVYL